MRRRGIWGGIGVKTKWGWLVLASLMSVGAAIFAREGVQGHGQQMSPSPRSRSAEVTYGKKLAYKATFKNTVARR